MVSVGHGTVAGGLRGDADAVPGRELHGLDDVRASKAASTAAGWTGTARFHGETRASYALSPGTATVPIVSASSSANGTAAGLVCAMVIASSVGSSLTLRRCTRRSRPTCADLSPPRNQSLDCPRCDKNPSGPLHDGSVGAGRTRPAESASRGGLVGHREVRRARAPRGERVEDAGGVRADRVPPGAHVEPDAEHEEGAGQVVERAAARRGPSEGATELPQLDEEQVAARPGSGPSTRASTAPAGRPSTSTLLAYTAVGSWGSSWRCAMSGAGIWRTCRSRAAARAEGRSSGHRSRGRRAPPRRSSPSSGPAAGRAATRCRAPGRSGRRSSPTRAHPRSTPPTR